jgi:hypothetical protein
MVGREERIQYQEGKLLGETVEKESNLGKKGEKLKSEAIEEVMDWITGTNSVGGEMRADERRFKGLLRVELLVISAGEIGIRSS